MIAMKTQVSKAASVILAALRYDLKLEKTQYLVLPICTPERLKTDVSDPPRTASHSKKNPVVIYLFRLNIARTRRKNRRAVEDTVT